MDTLTNIRTTPTVRLVQLLEDSISNSNQQLTNMLAYELTYRIYIPEGEKTFEEMLYSFGYKTIEKEKVK